MSDDFEYMVRRREIFEVLAPGATEADWPRLWEQAERSARAGAMAASSYNPDGVYRSLAEKESTRWKVSAEVLKRMGEQ